MSIRGYSLTAAAFAAVTAIAAPAQAQSGPTGVWIDHTGRGAVEISQCGEALCGRLVWMKDTGDTQACGVQILGEVKPAGSGVWGKGWIYDPEQNSKFDVELKPIGADQLRLVGYLGTKLFSETMTWKRAPGDLQRCDAKEQTAATAPPAGQSEPAPALPQTPSGIAPQPAQPSPQNKVPEQTNAADSAATQELSPPVAADKAPKQKPTRQANARSQNCKVELPWVSVQFPCPD